MQVEQMAEGSIPACAGEPGSELLRVIDAGVYPRVCGGARPTNSTSLQPRGLSPRVRGSRSAVSHPRPLHGSIPACAGEPGAAVQCRRPSWVYPRVCGGARSGDGPSVIMRGLSPRVRGSHDLLLLGEIGLGSIPACAGEPRTPSRSRKPTRVYPPRVRGSHRLERRAAHHRGSIPACAGEPDTPEQHDRPDWVYPRVCGGAEPSRWL